MPTIPCRNSALTYCNQPTAAVLLSVGKISMGIVFNDRRAPYTALGEKWADTQTGL